ncbi:phosphatase PAP2 family protein [Pseudalkalibacillus berkeleyi]|uniref:Phosphatase PAP2 family protein n=1 Tax=Pseudalkalibacillus berkeleyi TaxID=1069813 RepID=A0ABS9H403_9BACL|nr:phosphatase PAP2 family protein [Pseudalkalibacillus berkeleyi]MCF6138603.1 phosphatase PAP2 family protein [Pseudalkalibacillus berkeleyi]
MGKLGTQINEKVLQKLSYKLVIGIIATLMLIGVFGYLADSLIDRELSAFDTFLSSIVFDMQTPWLTDFMIFVTSIGDTSTYVVVVIIYLAVLLKKKLKLESLILLITILGAWGLNGALKFMFQRARPDIEHLIEVGGYSFPSGHAMVSIAAYGIMGFLIVQYLQNQGRSYWPVILLTSLLIFLIGFSRVYLHVHYPSDVIAGFSAGAVWLLTCMYAMSILKSRGNQKENSPL